MAKKKSAVQEHVIYHKNGSIWGRGQMLDSLATGYWEWYRKDGVRMRSGYFERGEQVGEWTTYDKKGAAFKVTTIKPKAGAKKKAKATTQTKTKAKASKKKSK